jgi:predicted nicotinamide N-methyase
MRCCAARCTRCCRRPAAWDTIAPPQGELAPSADGQYDSAFPNVGLIVWQAGFVLADYLIRACPWQSWAGRRVLELGCGTGG